ncbi:MAG: Uncharacterised protein [Cellulomonadaceae bacterium TMED98]|nr:MAG: Uncharacterised protein [Cellulomonadaceae bacterium TMED98]
MGFGGEVDNDIVAGEGRLQLCGVSNITLDELEAWVVGHRGEIGEGARVGQGVKNRDGGVFEAWKATVECHSHKIGTDKPRSAGDKELH